MVGKNTPLHFAVLNENLKAIEIICNQIDIKIGERNVIGQTPMDIALLIPKKTLSTKIVQYLKMKKLGKQADTLFSPPSTGEKVIQA